MNKLLAYFRKRWFIICVFLIAILAGILRLYNFSERWGFAYDQAHDVVIARYAVSHFQLPLLGPFSSAGPFQTGGEWYWFIMLGALLVPFTINGPWIFLALVQVIFVIVMIFLGKKLLGEKFGLLVGLFAAISPSHISQSLNLTNQAPLSLASACAIIAAISYLKNKSYKSLFLLALFISLGASIHLQGVALINLLIFTVIFSGIPNILSILLIFIGLIIPWIPVFAVDIQHNFFNTKNMLQYYLHDQYKIPLEAFGRRWLTYAGVFWPNSWANIIGFNKYIGYFLTAWSIFAVIAGLMLKKLKKEWVVLLASFLCMVIMLRYLRTPLFDSYLMFILPFVLLFTAYGVYFIFLKQKLVGVLFLAIITFFSMQKNLIDIKNSKNSMLTRVAFWGDLIQKTYPKQKFILYDYKYRSSGFSVPLVMYMQQKNMLNDTGYRIGFGKPNAKDDPLNVNSFPEIKGNWMGFDIVDINSSASALLTDTGWNPVNPSFIYKSTENWYLYK